MRTLIIPFIASLVLLSACKEDTAELIVNFDLKYNNETVNVNENLDVDNKTLALQLVKFYIGDLSLVNTDNITLVNEIALIDFSESNSPKLRINTVANDFTGLTFGLGVPDRLNSNPAQYDINHPLHLDNNMYWSMISNYIFTKFEGRIDSDTTTVVYHIGKTPFYREVTLDKAFTLEEGKTSELTLTINIEDLLDGIDIINENESHSQANKDALTTRVADNWVKAISIE